MIRVTYIDCDDIKKEHLVTHVLKPLDNCYRFLDIENETITEVSNKCDIKIEKQVKDLTLEECEKLGLAPCYHTIYSSSFRGYTAEMIYIQLKGVLEGNHFKLDDYIDITDLVKEGKRNG